MRRRHLLALVILALVVATVAIPGPVQVWDALTLVVAEEGFYEDGKLEYQIRVRFWRMWNSEPNLEKRGVIFESWWRNGRRQNWSRNGPTLHLVTWWPDGRLFSNIKYRSGSRETPLHGIRPLWPESLTWEEVRAPDFVAPPITKQVRYLDGQAVETRTSPPWFTEEEILQSVEGIEE